jgi:D(-)-tartrate dehydratase
VFQPFGGHPDTCVVADGRIAPSDAPGFGLEQKPGLAELIAELRSGG